MAWACAARLTRFLANLICPINTDDSLSEDALDSGPIPIALPPPELGRLFEIEQIVRGASSDPQGRDALAKAVINEEYIVKLTPLVSMAEDLESLDDLHRLCNIMKMVILLNDTAIMERVVADDLILGVVGALECTSTRNTGVMDPLADAPVIGR